MTEDQSGRCPPRRTVVSYTFEGGSYLELLIAGPIPTSEALDVLDELLTAKRAELRRLASAIVTEGRDPEGGSVERSEIERAGEQPGRPDTHGQEKSL